MAAEEVGKEEGDQKSSPKMSQKRPLTVNLEECSDSSNCNGYPLSKRSKLNGQKSCDEDNISGPPSDTVVGAHNMSESRSDDDDNDDQLEETIDENLFNEIGSLFDFRSSSALAAMMWIEKKMGSGDDPRSILKNMSVDENEIPAELDDAAMWKIIASFIADPPRRSKLENITTYNDAVNLIKKSSKIIVLTGAGVSVSCGIPDFRSRNGIYARLSVDYPDLPDPQAMFDIGYFKKNPKPFFKFAKEIYPGQFVPSISHSFIGALEKSGKLLRNYTQNIDTLEPAAGITRVIQCHGSFSTATCMVCKNKVNADDIREDVMNQVIPRCPLCPTDSELSILKPDIVFFGESLPEEFQQFEIDKEDCDLLIVMGSSLIVRPVAIIPSVLPSHVPQILINRETLPHMDFDVELLGDCDVIIRHLCKELGQSFADVLESSNSKLSLSTENGLVTSELTQVVQEDVMEKVEKKDEPDVITEVAEINSGVSSSENPAESSLLDGDDNIKDNPEILDEKPSEDIEKIGESSASRSFSKNKTPIDVVKLLDGKDFVCISTRKYVFHGAEVFEKDECSDDDDTDWSGDDDEDDDDDDEDCDGWSDPTTKLAEKCNLSESEVSQERVNGTSEPNSMRGNRTNEPSYHKNETL